MRASLLLAGLLFAIPSASRGQGFVFGSDLSYVNEMEDCGADFREGGEPKDVYRIFADRGANLVRVRLWNNPYWWQGPLIQPAGHEPPYSDPVDVRETIRRAKEAGMRVLLDFHYSDFWADPGRQLIPNEWLWAATSTASMKALVYQFTKSTLQGLDAEGLMPEIVQLGNEITHGLLTCTSIGADWRCNGYISPTMNNWSRHAQILNEAARAVREAGAASTIDPKIAIHLAGGMDSYRWRFDDLLQAGVTDFDVIGLSAYYGWEHYGDLDELEYYMEELTAAFPSYEVMVLETVYPWTTQNFDGLGNIATAWDYLYWPISPGKQLEYLTDYTRAVMRAGGTGVVFWEPAWVSTPCRTPWGQGSSHDHLVFFDPDETNFMEDGGGRWMERHFYEDLDAPKVYFQVDMTGVDVSRGVFVTGDLGYDTGAIVPMWPMGNGLYYVYAYLPAGSSGTLHFLNGPGPGDRETVPAACGTDGERPFTVADPVEGPLRYVWGACTVGVEEVRRDLPDGLALHPSWPNPFDRVATVSWTQPAAERVTLGVFDVLGRRVRTLVDGWMPAGTHEARLEAAGLPMGPLVVRMETGGEVITATLLLVR